MKPKLIYAYTKMFGIDRYSPVNELAIKFSNKFKHSSGERKTLTKDQFDFLRAIGVDLEVIRA